MFRKKWLADPCLTSEAGAAILNVTIQSDLIFANASSTFQLTLYRIVVERFDPRGNALAILLPQNSFPSASGSQDELKLFEAHLFWGIRSYRPGGHSLDVVLVYLLLILLPRSSISPHLAMPWSISNLSFQVTC
jgi:hypothetical protein